MTHTDVAPTRERYLVSLEALANISIICVSVLLAWVVKDRFLTRSAPAPRSALTIGMKLPLPSSALNHDGRSLIFVLRDTCHFCQESAEFHKVLARTSDAHGIKTVAVMPHNSERSQRYLGEHSIPIQSVVQSDADILKVHGVPTLIVVNRDGAVEKTWEGKLDASREQEVLEYVERSTPPKT